LPIGKANFLDCYLKDRQDSITERNIKSGWRGTGLFPKNRNIPLRSRQVVRPKASTPPPPQTPNESDGMIINTPKHIRDMDQLFRTHTEGPARRLVERKVKKAAERWLADSVILQHDAEALREQVASLQLKKRRKVVQEDPNQRFVTTGEVLAMQHNQRLIPEEVVEDTVPTRRSTRTRVPTRKAVEMYDDSEEGDD
jgi:4-hydroxybenzoate polyprenyltransferase